MRPQQQQANKPHSSKIRTASNQQVSGGAQAVNPAARLQRIGTGSLPSSASTGTRKVQPTATSSRQVAQAASSSNSSQLAGRTGTSAKLKTLRTSGTTASDKVPGASRKQSGAAGQSSEGRPSGTNTSPAEDVGNVELLTGVSVNTLLRTIQRATTDSDHLKLSRSLVLPQEKPKAVYASVHCKFSEIKEQTVSQMAMVQQMRVGCSEGVHDSKCIYEKGTKNLKVITAGGQDFQIPLDLQVDSVFPTRDGLIIQAVQAKRACAVTNLTAREVAYGLSQEVRYAHFSISGHPLNDVCPLAFSDRLQATDENLKVLTVAKNDEPVIVLWDAGQKAVKIGLIKKNDESMLDELTNENQEINFQQSLMPSSRHDQYRLAAADPELRVAIMQTIRCESEPDSVDMLGVDQFGRLTTTIFFASQKKLLFVAYEPSLQQFSTSPIINEVCCYCIMQPQEVSTVPVAFSGEHLKLPASSSPPLLAMVRSMTIDTIEVFEGDLRTFTVSMGARVKSLECIAKDQLKVNLTVLSQRQQDQTTIVRLEKYNSHRQDYLTQSMLKILQKTLNRDVYCQLYQDYTAMASSTEESAANATSFDCLSSLLLSMFMQDDLREQVALDQKTYTFMRHDLVDKKTTTASAPTAFHQLMTRKSNSLLKQFSLGKNVTGTNSEGTESMKPTKKMQAVTDPRNLQSYSDTFFTILHHLHEDLEVDGQIRRAANQSRLAMYLSKWLVLAIEKQLKQGAINDTIGMRKISYLRYYLSKHGHVRAQLQNQAEKVTVEVARLLKARYDVVLEKVPTLSATLAQQTSDEQFQVMFDATRRALRFNQILTKRSLSLVYPLQELVQADNKLRLNVDQFANLSQQAKFILAVADEGIGQLSDVVAGASFNLHSDTGRRDLRSACQEVVKLLSQMNVDSLSEVKSNLSQIQSCLQDQKMVEKTSEEITVARDAPQKGKAAASVSRVSADELDQMVKLIVAQKMHMNDDSSYREVASMLNCETYMPLKVQRLINFASLAPEEQDRKKTKMLQKLFTRQLSKLCGRAALLYGTQEMISTQTVRVAKICQRGLVPAVALDDDSAQQPLAAREVDLKLPDEAIKEMKQWPLFHAGAMSALQIALSFKNKRSKQNNLARNWIMQHRPVSPTAEHAGFVFALGLCGMLDTLQRTDVYQHLKTLHDSTNIGILLGKAASQMGSEDQQFSQTLCVHITFLQPPSLQADVSLPVQSAAMIGAALLHLGTQNKIVSDMLVTQIGRKPMNDRSTEREVYALSAGIALGLVNLGAGSKSEIVPQAGGDFSLDDRLIRFIEGGKPMEIPRSMLQSAQHSDHYQCSSIREGNQINVHITAAGGLFALTLIHLQSNNRNIANKLQMPDTFNQLESVRPPFLLQKVLSRNLIMWDQIEPTEDWVLRQSPEIISFAFNNTIATMHKKYANQIGRERVDFTTIAMCHTYAQTGAYLAVAYKYAGTRDAQAVALLQSAIKQLRKQKLCLHPSPEMLHQIYSDQNKNLIDRNTQETCLCMLAIGLSLVMAGSGDADCFRTLRVVRKRLESEMHFGHNMAINQALGMLFLGSGAFGSGGGSPLRKDKLGIAALLCSFYPLYPEDPGDNRHHLQALRHFWVLAVEDPRTLLGKLDEAQLQKMNVKQADDIEVKNASLSSETDVDAKFKYVLGMNKNQKQRLKEIEQLINNSKIPVTNASKLIEVELPKQVVNGKYLELSGLNGVKDKFEAWLRTQLDGDEEFSKDDLAAHLSQLMQEYVTPKMIAPVTEDRAVNQVERLKAISTFCLVGDEMPLQTQVVHRLHVLSLQIWQSVNDSNLVAQFRHWMLTSVLSMAPEKVQSLSAAPPAGTVETLSRCKQILKAMQIMFGSVLRDEQIDVDALTLNEVITGVALI